MFKRSQLKANAKAALKRYYWWGVLVVLILSFISGIGTNFSVNTGDSNSTADYYSMGEQIGEQLASNPDYLTSEAFAEDMQELFGTGTTTTATTAVVGLGSVFGILLFLFVQSQFEVGSCRFFTAARERKADLSDLVWTYKNNMGTVMGAQVCRAIYTFLWSLLLIIPGIVKSYEYSMIPYILAENPEVSRKRAFELSREMTKGHKWQLFVLDLSFIGWYILSFICCCGTLSFLLTPYIYATKAEAYTFLKARVIENGKADASEFPGFGGEQEAAIEEAATPELPAETAEEVTVETVEEAAEEAAEEVIEEVTEQATEE